MNNKKSIVKKVRRWIWPKMSFKRTLRYYWLRLLRHHDTNKSLAGGFAIGAAVSFSPIIGPHLIISLLLAKLTRNNMWTAALGSFVGNPWTFPFIWMASYWIGIHILPEQAYPPIDFSQFSFSMLLDSPWDILLPLLSGSALLAVFVWFLSYFCLKYLLDKYKSARKNY